VARSAWVFRPIVWFATASMLTTIVHELAHACAAYVLGVRSTLFNYTVDLDLTPGQAAEHQQAVIGIAGPLACLALGLFAWLAYKRWRGSDVELPLLYFSVFGIGTFAGNLMSAAFVGDFSAVAVALHVPMAFRYGIAVVGALSTITVHFLGGRELAQWAPANVGRVVGRLGIIALPALLGTAAVVLVNQPLPAASVAARFAESFFWFFAALGALGAGRPSQYGRGNSGLRWVDVAVTVFAVLIVRLMVQGIPFTPQPAH